MGTDSVDDFYNDIARFTQSEVSYLLPPDINKQIGHFNVFNLEDLIPSFKADPAFMPYNRRVYYKISYVRGKNRAEYADKVIDIDKNALLFGTPKIPYNLTIRDNDQKGFFCIFTEDFLLRSKSGILLDDLPIFKPGGYPVFPLMDQDADQIILIFQKIQVEIETNYLYKYDLIRNLVMELIHFGQKLQPSSSYNNTNTGPARVSSLFIELLERQFPIASPDQTLTLRTAKDYADRLAVHSNHLNKALKENTGKTTTEHISSRIILEARILLRHTDWNVSQIAYSLGFEQLSHFSSFFKKQTKFSPIEARNRTA